MSAEARSVDDLGREELVEFVLEAFHRTMIHYGLWFREAEYNLGLPKAAEIEDRVFKTGFKIQMKRLSKMLGFEITGSGVPVKLMELSRAELLELAKGQSVNWLASDGVWFQAVEGEYDMTTAKRLNDTCWTRYSPYEAERIKRFLNLGERSGLEGLKKALGFRTYAMVNKQSIHDTDDGGFVFQMNDCRVQAARKRRGLPDYPCSSVGNVEYPYFARAVDPRIETECLGCPPGEHPEEWYCAWKFNLTG